MERCGKICSLICAAAAAVTAFSIPAVSGPVHAAEERAVSAHIINGDFEMPDVNTVLGDKRILKPGYSGYTTYWKYKYGKNPEDAYIITNRADDKNTDIVYSEGNPWFTTDKDIFAHLIGDQGVKADFGWQTTATDGRMELVTATTIDKDKPFTTQYFNKEGGGQETTAGHGDQFAELVGTEPSSLYQDLATSPGDTLTWSLMHRARRTGDVSNTDTMAVFIGPAQTDLTKDSAAGNDIFMEMANLIILNEGEGSTATFARKVYSKPADGGEVTAADVSLTSTADHTEEWTCWIISGDEKQWRTYNGNYVVPNNQTETVMAFTALSGSNETGGIKIEGNCLDNIQFGVLHPLTVETMAGGTATISAAGDPDVTIGEHDPFRDIYPHDDKVTITAKSQHPQAYGFMGAMIDGKFVGIGDDISKGFVKQNDGSYKYEQTMGRAHDIRLIFASLGLVKYDKNGGEHGANTNLGQYPLNDITNSKKIVTTAPTPPENKGQFLYWELYTYDGTKVENAKISANHTIEFKDKTFIVTDNAEGGQTYTLNNSNASECAILLRAVYSRAISTQSWTRHFGTNMPEESNVGGTVSVKINGSGNPDEVEPLDEFTVTADAAPGYHIESWYYTTSDDSDKPVLINEGINGNTYTDAFTWDCDITVHVLFSEDQISPYLSVVPEDEAAAAKLSGAGLEPGVVYKGKTVTSAEEAGVGGDLYGNTISTSFIVDREFKVTGKPSGVWTINLPAIGTYIKVNEGEDMGKYPHLKDELIVDGENVENNKGTIYKAENIGNENHNAQMKFFVGGDTTLTTEGEIRFGLVIDNLYAPNASAGFQAMTKEQAEEAGVTGELDENNSVYTHSSTGYDPDALYNKTEIQ